MLQTRVLVVEDEAIVAEDVKGRLQEMGFIDCCVALNGDEALEQARQYRPDIVLMDIQLDNGPDGIETARQLCDERETPIVYLTAYSDDETLRRVRNMRPYGYLLKPCNDKELRTSIELGLSHFRTEQALREKSSWLATTLQSIGDGMIVTDRQGLVKLINPTAFQMMGLGQGAWLNEPVEAMLDIRATPENEPCHPLIRQAIQNSKVHSLPAGATLYRPDGSVLPLAGTVAPIITQEDQCIGAVLIFRDMTRQRHIEQQIIGSRDEIEMKNRQLQAICQEARQLALQANIANQFKSSFMAEISQEIRHPVNTIAGFSHLLAEEIHEGRLAEYLDIINASCQELTGKLDSLSDYTRIDTGCLELAISDYSLNDLMTNIDLVTRALASRKGLQFVIQAQTALPATIRTDPVRLRQCLVNVLDNAIKYTVKGYVCMKVTSVARDGQVILEFEIEDSGIGMPPGLQVLLQSSLPTGNEDVATHNRQGLGLAVTRHLIQMLGGRLAFRSVSGQGTVVSISVPVGPAAVVNQVAIPM